MYPLSSVTSSVADFVGAPDGEDGGGNKGATAKSDDLQQAELTPPTTSTALTTPTTSTALTTPTTSTALTTPTTSTALTTPTTSTALTTTVVKRVSTKGNGRAPAKNVDLDVFSSLGVALSPESTRIVEGIIIKVDALARRIYRSVIAKQLPSHVSKKLTVTGRGIWYFTYRLMCEDSFVSKCIGEYHYKHRPGFIRDLPRIQVFSDGSLVSLTGGGLLDFLSRLDGAIYNRIKSVFGSCWSEVSVTLEGESLSAVSCKDFIDALTIAGIPPVVMSLASVAAARCKVRARSKVTVECAASGVSTTDLTHSLPSGSQSLPPQPHTEFLSSVHSQSESRAGPSLPSEEASYTSSELIVPFSVGDSGGGSSSDLIAAKRHKDGGVYVPTGTDAVVIPSAVGVPPISSEANTLTSSAISSSSPCVSLSVQCVDLSGIELHPDSAELINKLFQGIRKSARKSFSSSMINYILTILSSELSPLEKAIWFKTYKELHLSKFMFKFACIYYYRYHIDFIRGLDDVRVLSSSSDRRLVPLGGVGLLNFLSRLRCAIRGEVRSTFNSEWDEVADKVFSDSVLEGESLSTLSCKDFIRVLDVVGVPVVALPISQRYYTTRNRRFAIRKREMLGSGSRSAVEGSGSSSVPHLQSETLPGSSSATTTSTTAAATGKKMGTKGKASARKRGTSAVAVSSSSAVSIGEVVAAESARGRFSAQKSAVALDCASLCAMVLPECALMIKGLFSKVGALARSIYEDMVSKQLPPGISDKLSVTERSIWYRTYKETCEVGFVSRCFGEYHTEHRPDFVRSLSKIQVLLDAEGDLLDFLLGLDCAIRREMESVFSSCWSKVSVSLEDESLSAISCRDFVRVLDIAGILAMALSTKVEAYIRKKGSKGEGVAPVISVVDLTRSSLPNPQSLPSQSSSSLPLGEASSAPHELTTLLSVSVGGPMGGSSSDTIVAKRHKSSDSVPVAGTICTTDVGVLPVSTEASISTASAVSISSYSASLSVQYVDLLGVRLHPDSAKLIYDLFFVIRKSAKTSCSVVLGNLLRSVSNGLSMVGQAVIWCRTYKELHLLGFMARFLCLYHSKYRPDFIRSLAGIRVFSSSSDCRPVPLSGEVLLSFLSNLDCAVREDVESIFNLKWDSIADSVFAGLEDISLSGADCEGFINIFDAVSAPVVVFSTYQEYEKKRVMYKRKKSGSGSKCTEEGTGSVPQKRFMSKSKTSGDSGKCAEVTESESRTVDLTRRLVVSLPRLEFQHELSSQPEREPLPKHHLRSGTTLGSSLLLKEDSGQSSSGFVKPLFYRHQPVSLFATATVSTSDKSSSNIDDGVSASTKDYACSEFGALAGEASPVPLSPHSISLAPLSSSPSTHESYTQSDMQLGFLVSTEESVVSALKGSGDDSLSPSSLHSIGPSSSSSYLSSSPSELGLDADVSSSSTESSVSNREIVGLATEVIFSESRVLVGESTPVSSSDQPIVPITVPSSVFTASIGEPSTAASSSSSVYVHGLKKALIMKFKRPFEVSTTSNVAAEPSSSSTSMNSSAVSGPSSSAPPVDVGNVPLVATATDTVSEDVGERLAALLNRGLSPSLPAGESSGSRGVLEGGASSHRSSAQRGPGRKRKRNS